MSNNLNELKLPISGKLYKYRYFDKDGNHVKILSKNLIFFSNADKFNDPFDCSIPYRYDLGNREQKFQLFLMHIEKQFPNIGEKEKRLKAKEIYKGIDFSIENQSNIQSEVINNTLGIFSLTEDPLNLLMWSHYADSHLGFCIEFDGKALWDFILWLSKSGKLILDLHPMEYKLEYPIINPYTEKIFDMFKEQALTKSISWNYEKEWRLLFWDGANKNLQIPKEILTGVIIGLKTSQENIASILKCLDENQLSSVKIKKCHKSDTEFSLILKEYGTN